MSIRVLLVTGAVCIMESLIVDCWADYRDERGNIVPDLNRFPGYDGERKRERKRVERGRKG